jgi:death on curing protein
MKRVRWLTVDGVKTIHADLITRYGGSHGLRDAGLLESAIHRARNLHEYERASVPRMAAAYAWGLVKNHAFVDGNKRIGLAALVSFLHLNGFELDCTEVEETAMILRAAASEITEEVFVEWVARVAKRLV